MPREDQLEELFV